LGARVEVGAEGQAMSEIDRVMNAFRTGRWVRPTAEAPNFVDLVQALACQAGRKGGRCDAGIDDLRRLIGPAKHVVFVLVDGLGMAQVETLTPDTFLRTHTAKRLQAVFLSTTATALVTLATVQWPCAHGVPGWWTRLGPRDLTAVTLPFRDRATQRPLEYVGVRAEEVFPV